MHRVRGLLVHWIAARLWPQSLYRQHQAPSTTWLPKKIHGLAPQKEYRQRKKAKFAAVRSLPATQQAEPSEAGANATQEEKPKLSPELPASAAKSKPASNRTERGFIPNNTQTQNPRKMLAPHSQSQNRHHKRRGPNPQLKTLNLKQRVQMLEKALCARDKAFTQEFRREVGRRINGGRSLAKSAMELGAKVSELKCVNDQLRREIREVQAGCGRGAGEEQVAHVG